MSGRGRKPSGGARRPGSAGPGKARRPSGSGAPTGISEPMRQTRPADIRNKIKRSQVASSQFYAKKAAKRQRRDERKSEDERLGGAAPARQEPRTLDNTREVDDTIVGPDDAEVQGDEADDEFAPYFAGTRNPKIMVTTQPRPSVKMYPVIAELLSVFPESFYYKRGAYPLKKIVGWAAKHGFTHLMVLGERDHRPSSMIISHLPDGPTACFRLSSSRLGKTIEGHGRATPHIPEIMLNKFSTRLGRRVGRFLGSLFPHKPEFKGRRLCTWHNQRDFIFFRQHRYIFEAPEEAGGRVRVRLQELGPRFTLKLKWLLASSFDTRFGDYEWFHKRHEMDTTRRKFHL